MHDSEYWDWRVENAVTPEDFKEAENHLRDAALVDELEGRDQPTRTKKSVTFKVRADEEPPMMQL